MRIGARSAIACQVAFWPLALWRSSGARDWPEGADWSIALYGDNLTDEATWGGDTVLPDSPLFGGDGVGGNAPPTFSPLNEGRVIGVELRVRR